MKRLLYCLVCLFPAGAGFAQEKQVSTEQWRPLYHFTPVSNWTNDPNGLLFLHGKYHLFNQQNPFENHWGHMSWGHATSTDLVHWKHLPIAIPEKIDRDTTWIFSGSAVWDRDNTSGFCKKGGCLVAIYTADQPNLQKESQFIAYSNDGGMSFTNYEKNPVIDLQKKDFRDPSVRWNAALKKWLMVVASPKENTILFYSSPNLKDWERLSEFGPAGLRTGIWECPSLQELPVTGGHGKTKWVLMASYGGGPKPLMQYFVGDFDGKQFINDNPIDTTLLVDEGNSFYAAIPWNDLPPGKNTFIGWMIPGNRPTFPWTGQMSIPRDLSLKNTPAGYRLVQTPAALVESQLDGLSGAAPFTKENGSVEKGHELILDSGHRAAGNAWWIQADLQAGPSSVAGFHLARLQDSHGKTLSETTIGYDAARGELFVEQGGRAGAGRQEDVTNRQVVAVEAPGGHLRLEILLDKSSLEIFADGGTRVLTTYIYPDRKATGLSVFSEGGKTVIRSLKYWDLSWIGKKQAHAQAAANMK